MSNDEWIATEFELNEMLFVPAGDGAVPLSNSRRTTPILRAKWGRKVGCGRLAGADEDCTLRVNGEGVSVIPSGGAEPSA